MPRGKKVPAAVVEDAPVEKEVTPGTPPAPTGWRDPDANYADDDNSIDARMWRLVKEKEAMNAR